MEDTVTNIEELKKEFHDKKKEFSKLRSQFNSINTEKEKVYRDLKSIRDKVKDRASKIKTFKEERDNLTKQVKEMKGERDKFNKIVQEKSGEKREVDKKKRELFAELDIEEDPSKLKRQVEELETKLETEPMAFKKEQQFNKTIKELKLQSYVNSPSAALMVDCYLRTGDRMAAFRFAFPNKELGKYWGKRLVDAVFKQDKVKLMIQKQVKEELEKAGLNPVGVLDKLDTTWNVASEKKNVTNMLACIDKYEEYLNFRQDEHDIPDSISGGAMHAIAAAFEEPASLIEETKTKMENIDNA